MIASSTLIESGIPPATVSACQAVLTKMPGAVFVVDSDLRYLVASGKSAGAILCVHDLEPDDVIGKRAEDVLNASHMEPVLACYRAVLSGHAVQFDLIRDGRVFETRGEPIRDATGMPVAAMLYCHDVTERTVSREDLRHERERALSALAEMMNAIDRAGHDINNPLTSVVSNLELIIEDLRSFQEAMPPQSPAELAAIGERIKELTQMAEDALLGAQRVKKTTRALLREPFKAPPRA